MRKLFLLTPLLATLAGCIDDTANYRIGDRDHALVVRVVQDAFWSKEATLRLIVTRMPDCQRQFNLGKVPLPGLEIELFASGPGQYTLRADDHVWKVETEGCSQLEAPDADAVTGQALGSFHLDEADELVFEAATPSP
jgi:hypothetical protein